MSVTSNSNKVIASLAGADWAGPGWPLALPMLIWLVHALGRLGREDAARTACVAAVLSTADIIATQLVLGWIGLLAPLIIVDEVGRIPIGAKAANLLSQLIPSRYERGGVIVASNKMFTARVDIFREPLIVAAMIDHMAHHAEVLSLKGDSCRLRDKKVAGSKVKGAFTLEAE